MPNPADIAYRTRLVDPGIDEASTRCSAADIADRARLVDPWIDHADTRRTTADIANGARLIETGVPQASPRGASTRNAADHPRLINAWIAGEERTGQGCNE